jgi:hypothetical protein
MELSGQLHAVQVAIQINLLPSTQLSGRVLGYELDDWGF